MKFFLTFFILTLFNALSAQESDTLTAAPLDNVTVSAFEQPRRLKDAAAATVFIGKNDLARYGPMGIVHAVNTLPGIRMEERSPASYRLNIRGSSLRSPFGVRNIKVYYNDLPFTDPGGHSYLNGLALQAVATFEVIKGPGSSVYGAGTGGVVLVQTLDANEPTGFTAGIGSGSYGQKNAELSLTTGDGDTKNRFALHHVESEGYRIQSAMARTVAQWNGRIRTGINTVLKTTFLYSRLYYQTPGALTKAEYQSDPRAARPQAGGFPSAVQNKAAIWQNSFLAGVNLQQKFSDIFSNHTSVYGMFTELDNAAVRNFSRSNEPHAGGRTSFHAKKVNSRAAYHVVAGAEFQQSFSSVEVYKNRNGEADSLQSMDEIPVRQSLVFLQASAARQGWELTAGGSLGFLQMKIRRSFPQPLPLQQRDFTHVFSPRVALAKSWKAATLYASISQGFSPPTSSELLPSGSALNLQLNAETGTAYDLGLRGSIRGLSFEVAAFVFRLQNTIVQRRDAGGGDFFTNAGRTSQHGVETSLRYPFFKDASFNRQGLVWLTHTWHRFRYKEFRQLNTDFSGHPLPGVAAHTVSAGVEVAARNGPFGGVSYFFSDRVPLNDATSEYAAAYHLLHARLGFEKTVAAGWTLKLIAGAENLLNQTYSLGNDANAFGGRFYNAAPGRNVYVSLVARFEKWKSAAQTPAK